VIRSGHPADTTLETLSGLKPAFKEDGKVTAGNASQISDGAAAVLLMEAVEGGVARAEAARADRGSETVGVDPVIMLTGPIPRRRSSSSATG